RYMVTHYPGIKSAIDYPTDPMYPKFRTYRGNRGFLIVINSLTWAASVALGSIWLGFATTSDSLPIILAGVTFLSFFLLEEAYSLVIYRRRERHPRDEADTDTR